MHMPPASASRPARPDHRRLLQLRARKLLRSARTPRYWRALSHGVFPSIEFEGLPFQTPDLVIDVGANHGQFALFASGRFPRAPIVCFEPVVPSWKVYPVVPRADFRPYACGASYGRVTIHVAPDDVLSSIAAPAPGSHTQEVIQVRLDSQDLPPFRSALLKIDVEGYEAEVIRGASGILDRVAQVLVECPDEDAQREVAALLAPAGLVPRFEHHEWQGKTDVLFARRNPTGPAE